MAADHAGYIGKSEPRPNAKRLLQGRGTYVDDLRFPRLAHVVFFRSPYAHARLKKLDLAPAARAGRDRLLRWPHCRGVLQTVDCRARSPAGHQVPPQHALAFDRACWQGEAVAAVIAEPRAEAEDALEYIEAEWEELPVVTDMEASLRGAPVIHPDLGDNICFKRALDTGGVDDAFAAADLIVKETYGFGRHAGVCIETRSISRTTTRPSARSPSITRPRRRT